jgi:DNA-binding NtrC family response regulator
MNTSHVLKDKIVLAVDDEADVLDTIEDILSDCIVNRASDFSTAQQYLMSYTYDIVILDIMGVNGFELLHTSVERGFPTVMLTAYAVTPEALEKSMQLGAVAFLPKDKMADLEEFIADVVLGEGKPVWEKLFDKFKDYFNKRFGPDWKQKREYFKEFEAAMKREGRQK